MGYRQLTSTSPRLSRQTCSLIHNLSRDRSGDGDAPHSITLEENPFAGNHIPTKLEKSSATNRENVLIKFSCLVLTILRADVKIKYTFKQTLLLLRVGRVQNLRQSF